MTYNDILAYLRSILTLDSCRSRIRDTLGKFLLNTPTQPNSQPSVFFGDCELPSLTAGDLEDPLCDQPEIFEYPVGEEEEEPIPHTHTMAEKINEGEFPIRVTNGDARMKNISPSSLPHFHGLTSEDHDTFFSEFFFVCRTYDYTSDDQKLKLFPSTIKDAALRWFMGLLGDNITAYDQM